MSQINGTVEAKSKKGTGILIGGQWYNSAYDGLFEPISKGDTIEGTLVSQNGKPAVSQITVTAKGAPQAQGGWKGKSGGSYQKKPYVDNSVGMAVGMGVNNATQLCIAELGKFDADYIEAKAIEIYQIAERLKTKAAAGDFSTNDNNSTPEVPVNVENNPFE